MKRTQQQAAAASYLLFDRRQQVGGGGDGLEAVSARPLSDHHGPFPLGVPLLHLHLLPAMYSPEPAGC